MPSFEGSSAGHQFIIGTSIGGQSTGHLLENHQTKIYWRINDWTMYYRLYIKESSLGPSTE